MALEEEKKAEVVADVQIVGREIGPLEDNQLSLACEAEAEAHGRGQVVSSNFVAGKETCEIGCGPDLFSNEGDKAKDRQIEEIAD